MFSIAIIFVALSLMICVAGIFSPNRLSGLEITFVVQYLFVVLIWIEKFNLPVYMLRMYRYSMGYAQQFQERSDTGVPPEAYKFEMDTSLFYNNFNFMGVTYIVTAIGILISYIKFRCKMKKLRENVENISKNKLENKEVKLS